MLRKWLKRVGSGALEERTIDDLIVLGRLSDAEARLLARLKVAQGDRHARAQLGDVLGLQGRRAEAVDHYVHTADTYLDDGFFDKAAALLVKASRLQPDNGSVKKRLQRVEYSKLLQQVRREALEGLREGAESRGEGATLELETIWKRIEDSDFPSRFPVTHVRRLFSQLEVVKIGTKEALRRPGDRVPELYIVGPGEIEAVVPGQAGEVDLAVYTNGDIFGEAALLSLEPWKVLYRTTKATTMLRLDRAGLERALHGNVDPRGLLDALRSQGRDAILGERLTRVRQPR
ncbi:MAG TPA: cyclic nucleotide-binding domain-containing protein [Thermoanaerobaculia bacterium]|nr:cyclic nucleotide-binding domain-containing protein [Thermoanaerobaculia bacterium]